MSNDQWSFQNISSRTNHEPLTKGLKPREMQNILVHMVEKKCGFGGETTFAGLTGLCGGRITYFIVHHYTPMSN